LNGNLRILFKTFFESYSGKCKTLKNAIVSRKFVQIPILNYISGVKAPLGGKCHVKNRKYSSLDLEIDPS
jgi:hypothetical protein